MVPARGNGKGKEVLYGVIDNCCKDIPETPNLLALFRHFIEVRVLLWSVIFSFYFFKCTSYDHSRVFFSFLFSPFDFAEVLTSRFATFKVCPWFGMTIFTNALCM